MTDGQDGNGASAPPSDDEPPSRRRGRRARGQPRAITISIKHRRDVLGETTNTSIIEEVGRPQTRADCRDFGNNVERPCPWVACKHHLYIDVNPETGSIKINFPDKEPWELEHSCALDVAELGGITLEEVGEMTNLTRERVRQVEVKGLMKLKMYSPDSKGSHDYVHPDTEAVREALAPKARRRRRPRNGSGDA